MALVGKAEPEAKAKASTRAKWRALPSARSSTLKKYLTPPALSETPVYVNYGLRPLSGLERTNALRQIPGYEKIMDAVRLASARKCSSDSSEVSQ